MKMEIGKSSVSFCLPNLPDDHIFLCLDGLGRKLCDLAERLRDHLNLPHIDICFIRDLAYNEIFGS